MRLYLLDRDYSNNKLKIIWVNVKKIAPDTYQSTEATYRFLTGRIFYTSVVSNTNKSRLIKHYKQSCEKAK